jgi:thiol-disulfide isomerase/thioredoxin
MVKRNALTAALFALILATALTGVQSGVQAGTQTPAAADQAPPLLGAFGDNFTLLYPFVPAPPETFTALDGAPVRLADFKGRVVLLNFWATWCAPCIREMPSLDRLQAALEDRGLAVLAVSIDRGGAKVVRPFAKRLGLDRLALYLDAKAALFKTFGVTGLPTTFLIDRQGDIVGAYAGAAEWDGPEARALIEHYLRQPASAATVKTAG